MTDTDHFSRNISLRDATFILVGYVVGASIFILPAELAQQTGPAVWLAFVLAALPAVFVCFVTAQVGSAFPVSGASYVAVRECISPFWAFVATWTIFGTIAVGMPLMAFGFAKYLSYFVGEINETLVGIACIGGFTLINIFGVNVATRLQAIFVVEFLIALLVFGFWGAFIADPALSAKSPLGPSPRLASFPPWEPLPDQRQRTMRFSP